MTAGSFSRRSVFWLVAIAASSLLASGLLAAFGGELSEVQSFGADSYSRSALGQRAFLETLRALGYQVLVSRHDTAGKATEETVVILAEPQVEAAEEGPSVQVLRDIARRATRLLVVLPKRAGRLNLSQPAWISGAELLPADAAKRVLDAVLDPDDEGPEASAAAAEVVRSGSVTSWRGELPTPSVDSPQLVRSSRLAPLLWSPEGMLAGELIEEDRHLVVLTDPDLIETHGLGCGANAEIAVRLLERLGERRVLLLDETLHGHQLTPSLTRDLLRFPVVLATLNAILVAALLVWAGLVRFGRPNLPPPALELGKAFLMENTASLLRYGGHLAPAVAAYWRATREQIESSLRSPGERSGGRDEWLERTAAARGRGREMTELERRVAGLANRPGTEHQALQIALAIHRFREQMVGGNNAPPPAA